MVKGLDEAGYATVPCHTRTYAESLLFKPPFFDVVLLDAVMGPRDADIMIRISQQVAKAGRRELSRLGGFRLHALVREILPGTISIMCSASPVLQDVEAVVGPVPMIYKNDTEFIGKILRAVEIHVSTRCSILSSQVEMNDSIQRLFAKPNEELPFCVSAKKSEIDLSDVFLGEGREIHVLRGYPEIVGIRSDYPYASILMLCSEGRRVPWGKDDSGIGIVNIPEKDKLLSPRQIEAYVGHQVLAWVYYAHAGLDLHEDGDPCLMRLAAMHNPEGITKILDQESMLCSKCEEYRKFTRPRWVGRLRGEYDGHLEGVWKEIRSKAEYE